MKLAYKTGGAANKSGSVVHFNPVQLAMLLLMHVEPAIGIGTALYSARGILQDRGGDVWETVRENFL